MDDIDISKYDDLPTAASGRGDGYKPRGKASGSSSLLSKVMLEVEKKSVDEKRPMDFTRGGVARNLFGGLGTGLLAVLLTPAFAMLFVSEIPLAGLMEIALYAALASVVVGSVMVALFGNITFASAGPESTSSVIPSLLALALFQSMNGSYAETEILSTIVASMSLSAVAIGFGLVLMGMTKSGRWARFVPRPILGGIWAALGWFILQSVYFHTKDGLLCPGPLFGVDLGACYAYGPAFAYGAIMFTVMRFAKGSTALFLLVALPPAAFVYLKPYLADFLTPEQLGAFFLPAATLMHPVNVYDLSFFDSVQWGVLGEHAGWFLAAMGLTAAALIGKVSDLEVSLPGEVDTDAELKSMGTVNVFAGALGGMPISLSRGRSSGNRGFRAMGRISGIVAGCVCAACLVFSDVVLPMIPSFLPAAVLVFMGLQLMWHWMVEKRGELMQRNNYTLMLVIFGVTIALGPLAGVAAGAAMSLVVLSSRYGKMSVVKHVLSGAAHRSNVDRPLAHLRYLGKEGERMIILRLQGFLFHAAASDIFKIVKKRLKVVEDAPLNFVVLDFTFVSAVDASMAADFNKLKKTAQENKFILVFAGLSLEALHQLEKAGTTIEDPENNSVFFASLDYALEHCEDALLDHVSGESEERADLESYLREGFSDPKYVPLLLKVMRRVEVKKGGHVFHQGDRPDGLYFIEKGMVEVRLETPGGGLLRLKKMGPGTVVGEMGIYTDLTRSASVVAVEDCILHRLSGEVLDVLETKKPGLASSVHRFMITVLSQRVADMNKDLRNLLAR
jgi:SulP family sulfate permease